MRKTDFIILLFCANAAILHRMSGFGFPMLSTGCGGDVISTQYCGCFGSDLPVLLLNVYMLRVDATQSIFSSLYGYCKEYQGFNSSVR